MQETPEILSISNMLERPVGRYMSYGLFCIGPAVAMVLAAARRSYAAVVVATGGFVFLIVVANLIILKCATSLIQTISRSLRNSGNTQTIASCASVAAGTGQDETLSKRDPGAKKERISNNLLVARKKITMALSICIVLAVPTILLLLFALLSAYGKAAPLMFFGIPM